MLRTWVRTVLTEMNITAAISSVVSSSERCPRTSRSLSVSGSKIRLRWSQGPATLHRGAGAEARPADATGLPVGQPGVALQQLVVLAEQPPELLGCLPERLAATAPAPRVAGRAPAPGPPACPHPPRVPRPPAPACPRGRRAELAGCASRHCWRAGVLSCRRWACTGPLRAPLRATSVRAACCDGRSPGRTGRRDEQGDLLEAQAVGQPVGEPSASQLPRQDARAPSRSPPRPADPRRASASMAAGSGSMRGRARRPPPGRRAAARRRGRTVSVWT